MHTHCVLLTVFMALFVVVVVLSAIFLFFHAPYLTFASKYLFCVQFCFSSLKWLYCLSLHCFSYIPLAGNILFSLRMLIVYFTVMCSVKSCLVDLLWVQIWTCRIDIVLTCKVESFSFVFIVVQRNLFLRIRWIFITFTTTTKTLSTTQF